MLENTLPQLEQLIEKIIDKNNKLQTLVAELEQQKASLLDENETFQPIKMVINSLSIFVYVKVKNHPRFLYRK